MTLSENPALMRWLLHPREFAASVRFDGSGSSDSDGTPITKFEWDLDGNGIYERDTGTTATTTRRYPVAGSYVIKMRVTSGGETQMLTYASLRVHAPPEAALSATPGVALVDEPVELSGAGSTDDGSISKYEWDLDGAPGYELDTAATATTTHSFATAGTYTVGLRVTDNYGATATRTGTVVVHRRPTAVLSVSPGAPFVGQNVAFSGAASSDDDGITKYEWDLDGNGSFELDTGTTPTASRTYGSPRTLTVRLRVTDQHGATAVATRDLTVAPTPGPGAGPPGDPPPALTGLALRGRSLSYQLSEPATVTFVFRRCATRRRCAGRRRTLTDVGEAGNNSIRLARRRFRPGLYRVVVTATDSAGQQSSQTRRVRVRRR